MVGRNGERPPICGGSAMLDQWTACRTAKNAIVHVFKASSPLQGPITGILGEPALRIEAQLLQSSDARDAVPF